MKAARTALAAVVAIVGVALSIYFGIVVMFVGGVSQIVDEVNADTANGAEIAWGILRIVFAGTGFAAGVLATLGLAALIGGTKR